MYKTRHWSLIVVCSLLASSACAAPDPCPEMPGQRYILPRMPTSGGAPVIYSCSGDAAPDESFFAVGNRLTPYVEMWGRSDSSPIGELYQAKTQFSSENYLIATIPEKCYDGPFVVWIRNENGRSKPFILNQPQPWWCAPSITQPGTTVRVFGRNLSRRPDFEQAFVYLCKTGAPGVWLNARARGKYCISLPLPQKIEEGEYELWVHAGAAGVYGWGSPLKLTILSHKSRWHLTIKPEGSDLQGAISRAAKKGAPVALPAGTFLLDTTLQIPSGVTVRGAGKDKTFLQLSADARRFPRLMPSGWNKGPARVHNIGDSLEYDLEIPLTGDWKVWMRYATEMSKWHIESMDNRTALLVDNGEPTYLANLPNTGSFGTFRWSDCATLELTKGKHRLVWKNIKGGGLHIDALVFASDEDFTPSDQPYPSSSERVVVIQGEEVARMVTRDGHLPGSDATVVWLQGDGASISDVTILGSARVNIGVFIGSRASTTHRRWLRNCRVERVRIADVERKDGEICGIQLANASHSIVRDSKIQARAPLFLSGVYQCQFTNNRLLPVTRYGGNANAAIVGRTSRMEECLIENNVVIPPIAAEAGGPTVRRLIWISTGSGSVTHNCIAGNRGDGARYGGVAATIQNVGETILFEAKQRVAYYGPLEAADLHEVVLPESLAPTPDDFLGNVKRESLAHNDAGQETFFPPPHVEDGGGEPPITEYYVTILKGRGQGQTRRIVSRIGITFRLSSAWREVPEKGCLAVVSTLYHQNLVIDNETIDGMTGVQLWIGCVENIISGNIIARQRKPGIFLYGNCTTLASSMPPTWNRGIGPLYWNHCEGNRTEECSSGILVTANDSMPAEWPPALGNVVRRNSFIKNRIQGVIVTSRSTETKKAHSVVGTLVEFNVVRDAIRAFHTSINAGPTLFRRNHAYFWHPMGIRDERPVAFQIDNPDSPVVIDENTIEGKQGVPDQSFIPVQKGLQDEVHPVK